MDMKLRTALMNLQTNYGEAARKLDKASKDYNKLVKLGQKVYKKALRDTPDLAEDPVWENFREELDIPVGTVDPVDGEAPEDDALATVDAVEAVTAVNKITTYSSLSPEKRATLLESLEAALENARAHLNLPVEG